MGLETPLAGPSRFFISIDIRKLLNTTLPGSFLSYILSVPSSASKVEFYTSLFAFPTFSFTILIKTKDALGKS